MYSAIYLDNFQVRYVQTVKKGGRNHSLFILNCMQTNTTQRRHTPKSIKWN